MRVTSASTGASACAQLGWTRSVSGRATGMAATVSRGPCAGSRGGRERPAGGRRLAPCMASMTTRTRSARRSSATPPSGSGSTRCRWTGPGPSRSSTPSPARRSPPTGIGGLAALELFDEELAPACLSTDHPRYLSFIPCAPTEAAAMFDLVVGASSIYGGSWLEGAGAVYAENEALRWIADLAGLPPAAGGVFVPGGTIGNLSALVAARHAARAATPETGSGRPARQGRRAPTSAHSSIQSACDVMDAEFIGVDGRRPLAADRRRPCARSSRTTGPRRSSPSSPPPGTTNFGIVDDLASVAEVCREFGIWFHVDGAYGGAGAGRALACATCTPASSTPTRSSSTRTSGCSRRSTAARCSTASPPLARAAHTQQAGYLDVLTDAARLEPHRLLGRPDPPGPRPAVLVLARHPRHRRLHAPRSSARSR